MDASTQTSWRTQRLRDLLTYEQPGRYLVRSTNYVRRGKYPVLTAGKTFLLGYTNETDGAYTGHPVIIFDDFTTASKYVDFDFKAKSSAMKMLTARPGAAHLRFVYERMQLIKYPIFDHKRRWIAEFSKLEIDAPDLAEQTAVAEVADDLTTQIATLERLIAKKQAIKQGMMQQLLTGRTRLAGFTAEWRSTTIGSVAEQHRRTIDPRKDRGHRFQHFSLPAFDDGELPVNEPGSAIDSIKFLVPPQAVLVAKLNPRIPRIWAPNEIGANAIASTEFVVMTPNPGIDRSFMKWLLKSDAVTSRMRLLATGTTGSHARIHPRQIAAFEVTVPDEVEQVAIATILDDTSREIDLLGVRLIKARSMKTGMMQQLLTGRVRLPVETSA